VLFLIAGAVWLAVAVASGELVLVWPGLASILGGVSLLLGSGRPFRRPLCVASSIFGFVIALYQTYLAATLFGTPLGALVVYSFVTFVVLMALEVVLLYLGSKTWIY
jgi:hypothetical protein